MPWGRQVGNFDFVARQAEDDGLAQGHCRHYLRPPKCRRPEQWGAFAARPAGRFGLRQPGTRHGKPLKATKRRELPYSKSPQTIGGPLDLVASPKCTLQFWNNQKNPVESGRIGRSGKIDLHATYCISRTARSWKCKSSSRLRRPGPRVTWSSMNVRRCGNSRQARETIYDMHGLCRGIDGDSRKTGP